jgi:phospholipid transport system substrate-binding protein
VTAHVEVASHRIYQENKRMNVQFKIITKWFFALALSVVAALPVQAQEKSGADPYQQIEQVTTALLDIIATYREGYPANEQAYFTRLDALLASHVDFGFISRNVMGGYGRTASADQRQRFARTFRAGLVETYGRGLIGYEDQEIVLLPAGSVEPGQRRLTVKQEIRSADAVYPLEYSMARKKSGEWMVVNVVINGINLGKTFRNQFDQAAQRAAGDIDKVISDWSTD